MVQEPDHRWASLRGLFRRPCRPAYRTVRRGGPPWWQCDMPEPAWLKMEHSQPWHSVDRALILGPPESELPAAKGFRLLKAFKSFNSLGLGCGVSALQCVQRMTLRQRAVGWES